MSAGAVSLHLAGPADEEALANLFQLYVHDFSEMWSGLPQGEVEDDGRFAIPFALAPYWTAPDHAALLIRVGGRLAGFVLTNAVGKTGLPLDRNMKDFFVVRKHRRGGVGLAAAHAAFARFPGRWEAAVYQPNVGALAFWRRAVASYPGVGEIEEHAASSPGWAGRVLRFATRAPH